MSLVAEVVKYKGKDVIFLACGRYTATIAPFLGSNIMRMQDTENEIDFFRNDESLSPEELQESAEVYGFPTLYLPNRLSNGILKCSDHTYQFPINDPLGNSIHGFLHKREHEIVSAETVDGKAVARTAYTYDEKDPFFETYPVSFKAEFTFTLSEEGMDYEFTMTNLSDRQLPYGVCNHTAFNGPFVKGAEPLDTRIYVPIGDKWQLSAKCIPTLDFTELDHHDKQYLTGSMIPVKHIIDNDVYYAEEGEVDDKPFYGALVSDLGSGKQIRYEVCRDFKYWIIWNDRGDKGYFCPEPSTWIIDAPNLPLPAEETGYAELAPGESKTVTEKIYSYTES